MVLRFWAMYWLYREPHIANRIRKLSFRHFRWFNELEVKASSKRTSFSLVKGRLMGSIRNELKTVIDVIIQFSRLSSLHVQWSSSYDLRTFRRCMPPILHACWGAFSGSLRSVSLDIPIELLNEVAPKVVLRRLESLSLSFYALPGADNSELLFSDAVRTNILPFLNNHTRSLQTMELSLRTAGSWMHPSIFRGEQFDFGPLFKGLYYVPHLNSLALDITPSTSISSVSRLLKAHANTLHTLAISAIDFHGDPLDHLLQEALVPLPYLINLTINFDLSEGPISSGILNECLKQYMPTLTSLKLLRKPNQTGDILQMFNRNSGCFLGDSPLKNLNIAIESLTPGILDLAAAGLPNLHTLSLSICYFNTHHMNPRNEEYEVRFTLLPILHPIISL